MKGLVKPYAAKISVGLEGTYSYITAECDPGILSGEAEVSSYNTPGSPNWNRLFKKDGRWLDADDAKDLIKNLQDGVKQRSCRGDLSNITKSNRKCRKVDIGRVTYVGDDVYKVEAKSSRLLTVRNDSGPALKRARAQLDEIAERELRESRKLEREVAAEQQQANQVASNNSGGSTASNGSGGFSALTGMIAKSASSTEKKRNSAILRSQVSAEGWRYTSSYGRWLQSAKRSISQNRLPSPPQPASSEWDSGLRLILE